MSSHSSSSICTSKSKRKETASSSSVAEQRRGISRTQHMRSASLIRGWVEWARPECVAVFVGICGWCTDSKGSLIPFAIQHCQHQLTQIDGAPRLNGGNTSDPLRGIIYKGINNS